MPPSENEMTVKPWARVLAALYSSIAPSMRAWVRRLDGVGADDRRADDRLGDRGQHHADLAADDAVGLGELALEVAQRDEERCEADPDHDRELPAVEDHHDGRDQHLAGADDEEQAAEDQELADLVDVAGHPGDEHATALGVLGEDREVVHVAERLDPQRRQPALGRGEQPLGHEERRQAGHARSPPAATSAHEHGERDVRAVRPVEAAVEGLLDDDRHDDLADRGDDREGQRAAEALLELRADLDAAADGVEGGDVLAGVHRGADAERSSCSCSISSTVRALTAAPPSRRR